MRRLNIISLTGFLLLAYLCATPGEVRASGEIILMRAPEEIPEGDDLTVALSATPREKGIDRTVVIDIPNTWRIKRAWKVEAGGDAAIVLKQVAEIKALFTQEAGREVLAFADNALNFDPDAPGIAYFFTFETKPGAGTTQLTSTVKSALVERSDPDAAPEIDKKTKKPIARNTAWRMVFPPKGDFSFSGITTKRLVQQVRMLKVVRNSRAMVLEGNARASAELRTRPEIVTQYFQKPFSVSFWFRTTSIQQNLLRMQGASTIQIGIGFLGQPYIAEVKPDAKTFVSAKSICNDGAWHHLLVSYDAAHKLRLFIDAAPPAMGDGPAEVFMGISGIQIGGKAGGNDFSIDELRLYTQAFAAPQEFERSLVTAARDTLRNTLAVFHFDDFGGSAHSSEPLEIKTEHGDKSEFVPILFALDSNVSIEETSSPVQLEQVLLSADLISPTKVNINWRTSSEVGIKQYRLERRVGSFGAFEKVLVTEAKHGIRTPKRGQSIISRNVYSAVEDLPKLTGDIELFYRLAVVGFDDKTPLEYSQPINLEYGVDRDIFVEQNQPNPFNPTTTIAFRLTKTNTVRLSIFDIVGRELAVLVNGKLDPGRHAYTLDATNWPGGIYFYKVRTTRSTVTRKMVLAK